MRIVRTSFIAAALLALAGAAHASDPFYTTLLTRGISDAQRGDAFHAARELRIAAFGLVDDPAQYLRAQVYLAHAYEKLNQRADAAASVEKASLAERITPSYVTTAIDPDTRSAFESLAIKMLRPEQLALVPAFRGRSGVRQAPSPVLPPSQTATNRQAGAPVAPPEPVKAPVVSAPAPAKTAVVATPAPAPTRTPVIAPPPPPAKTLVKSPLVTQAPSPVLSSQKPPASQPTSPLVAAARHQPSLSAAAGDASQQISDAQRMLNEGKILAARQIYMSLAQTDGLSRTSSLDVAKGLNQTSAWRESSAFYQKLMPFRSGEELHQFYEAVNKYELGDVNAARDLMTRALPALPVTRETSLYKSKILGTQ